MRLTRNAHLAGRNAMIGSLVLAALLRTDVLGDFPSENVTLLSQILAADFPGAPQRGNDCWGYVSDSGREYALMGMRNGMAVVEVTDPSFPVIIQSIPHTESNWSGTKTYQHYAYVVNEGTGGIDVVDLSDIDNGNVTLVQSVTEGGVQSSHNVAIDEDSGFLYLCGADIDGNCTVSLSDLLILLANWG